MSCTQNCLDTVPELHLDLSSPQNPVLHLEGFLYKAKLNLVLLNNSSLHVLLLDLAKYTRDLCCTLTSLHTGA